MNRFFSPRWIGWSAVLCLTVLIRTGAGQEIEGLMSRARTAMREGRLETAEAILNAVRRARSEDPRPYLALGDLAFARREYARSVQLYGKALGLSPGNLKILVGLAKGSYFAGDLEGAKRRLREALSRNPTDSESRAYLAYLGEPLNWPEEIGKAAASKRITRGEMAGFLAVHTADWQGLWKSPFTPVLTDISSHWGRDQILNAVRRGWMAARPDHTFGPGERMKRATLAQVLYNIFHRQEVGAGDLASVRRPVDMAPQHRALRAVLFSLGRGLMRETGDGAFSPLGPVSGVEAIEALERVKRLLYPMGLEGG